MKTNNNECKLQQKTIDDFGEQWTSFQDNSGFYGSIELFKDFIGPLLDVKEIRNCKVGDIGSGTGRIVSMILGCGAKHVVAVEPSRAFDVLVKNTRAYKDKITYLNVTGDKIPPSGDLDFIFSYGVLLCIPDPQPTVKAALSALKPGGKFVVWVYGKEGNGLYLALVEPLRYITKRLPHSWLDALTYVLDYPVRVYISLCRFLPFLPLGRFMIEIMGKLTPDKRRLNMYDQLNPTYCKYYTSQEAEALLRDGGFENVLLYHRHGYSWTVIGTKPGAVA